MAALKFHPRETLPNRTALARAEALYVELSGDARAYLGEVMVAFRATLDRQNPDEVELARAALVDVVRSLARG